MTVPGAVDGWQKLLERFGKKNLGEVLAPAIQTADEGFPVTEWIAGLWSANVELLRSNDAAAQTYLPADKAPAVGQVFRNPDLAHSLRQIAQGGRDAFYKGEIAKRIVETSKRHGGTLTASDFADYSAANGSTRSRQPIAAGRFRSCRRTARGWPRWKCSTSWRRFRSAKFGLNSTRTLHTMIEAKKLAYADLVRYIGDPKFSKLPVAQLLSKDFAAKRAKLIDPNRPIATSGAGSLPSGGETIYLSVVDRDGNMVSLIQSNYEDFGSGMVADGHRVRPA